MRDVSPSRQRLASSHSSSARSQVLALSVMRLTAPLPNRTHALPFMPQNPPDPSTETPCDELLRTVPTWESEGAPCGVGSLSVLPSSFGSIYASETFRCFISVFNQSTEAAESVTISVHMQTASQRIIPLLDTSKTPRAVLQPRAGINNIVKIGLGELGIHKLLCAASFQDGSLGGDQVSTLRKVFRFNVLPPLEPCLNVIPLYRGVGGENGGFAGGGGGNGAIHYLVDLRVLNAVPVPVYITGVSFVAKGAFRVRQLDRDGTDGVQVYTEEKEEEKEGGRGDVIDERKVCMGVGDTRSFLFDVYKLGSKSEIDNMMSTSLQSLSEIGKGERKLRRSVTVHGVGGNSSNRKEGELGEVTIRWRSAHGEVGQLEKVARAIEPKVEESEVEVEIYAVPEKIVRHQPFTAQIAVRNNSRETKRLYVQIRRDLVGEVVPVGVSGVSLGEVGAGGVARCSMRLMGLQRGQHGICGVRVVDIDSNVSYKAQTAVLEVG